MKKIIFILMLLVFVSIGFSEEVVPKDLIGKTLNLGNLPANYKLNWNESFVVSVTFKEKRYALFVQNSVPVGNAWIVRDVMPDPGITKCSDANDPEIYGITFFNNKGIKTDVKVWRANRATSKFEPLSGKGLSCQKTYPMR